MSFRFRHFAICDDHCAMKVGTDGVLLGAWADVGKAQHIVDVGCGSGLIAIMLAQRYDNALVTGVEIDADAAAQAADNMAASPWSGRLRAVQADFLSWHEPADAVVCNPPFFVRSLRCPDPARSTARHTDTLPLEGLAQHATALLRPDGVLAVVLPADALFQPQGLYLRRRCMVQTTAAKPPKRQLLEFVKSAHAPTYIKEETLTLQEPNGARTAAHQHLTQEFYL